MDAESQVVIPDLDDENLLDGFEIDYPNGIHSPSGSQAAGRMSPFADDAFSPSGLFRTAPRTRTGGSGSMQYDDSASIISKSSFRFGGSISNAMHSPTRATERGPTTPFSFPVKKPSFASLRAAIKGQSTPNKDVPDPMSPSFFAPALEQESRRGARTVPHDITAVSSGLAQATGMRGTSRWHKKSSSQTSVAPTEADVSLGITIPSRSPSRVRPMHAHHGSALSEYSLDGFSMASPASACGAQSADGLSSPYRDTPPAPTDAAGQLRTPIVLALEQVVRRFAAAASRALDAVMYASHDEELLRVLFPTSADAAVFDEVLGAFSHIAQHNSALVIRHLLSWRAMAMDQGRAVVRRQPSESTINSASSGSDDALQRRKALTVTYLVCRALIRAVPPRSTDLSDAFSEEFLTLLFQLLHLCSIERENERGGLTRLHATLQQHCFDTVARLLGELSRVRLQPIGAHFLSILQQSGAIHVTRDRELLTEAAILGMRYMRITVYPMEEFEQGAELFAALSRFFANSHGYRIKRAFARVLCAMLLPVAKTASAELHHPLWVNAVAALLPKAQSMAGRNRYWNVAFPLWTAALCAAPPDTLLAQWSACLDMGHARLKERSSRATVLQCATQLFWAYLFRCHEGTNPTTRRLDAFFHAWLPSQRGGIAPSDTHLDPYVAMLHYALYRQFDYTKPLLLALLCHAVLENKSVVHQPEILQPTKMRIAIRAIARTLHCYVEGETPSFPLTDDPTSLAMLAPISQGDAPSAPIAFPTAPARDAQATFNELISQIALISDYQVKDVNVFDVRVPIARGTNVPATPGDKSAQDREHYVLRTHAHGAFTVVYPREQQAYMDLLRTCFDTWPRCFSSALTLPTVISMLFRAQYSAEPALQRASAAALLRIAHADPLNVVRAYMRWAFRQDGFVWELVPHADVLLEKMVQSARLFIELLDTWWSHYKRAEQDGQARETLDEIEACAMYLLCTPHAALRDQAITVLRLVTVIHRETGDAQKTLRMVHFLEQDASAYLAADDAELGASQRAKIERWRAPVPLHHLAVAADTLSHSLWLHAWPRVLADFAAAAPDTTALFHAHVASRIRGMDQQLRQHPPPSDSIVRVFWRTYIISVCATAPADGAQLITMLVPYLDDAQLRSTVATALGCVPQPLYIPLLEAIGPQAMAWSATCMEIARIFFLTAPRMPAEAASHVQIWIQHTLGLLHTEGPALEVCQMRRYFSAVLAQYLAVLGPRMDACVSLEMRVHLFPMVHDWCTIEHGSRLAAQLAAAAEHTDVQHREQAIVQQRQQLHVLAMYAERALAALCAGPLAKDDLAFDTPAVLAWIGTLLASPHPTSCARGQDTVRAMLLHNPGYAPLLDGVLAQSYRDIGTPSASRTMFAVLAQERGAQLLDGQALAIALVQLGHAEAAMRAHALALLDARAPALAMPHAVRATSAQPSAYLDAQRAIAALAAEHHAPAREAIVGELVVRMAEMPHGSHGPLLSVLAPWLAHTPLSLAPLESVSEEKPYVQDTSLHLLPSTFALLTNLATLTLLHCSDYPMQVRTIWEYLLGTSHRNASVLTSFLLHSTLHFQHTRLLATAQYIVACIDEKNIRAALLSNLCAHLAPSAMIVQRGSPVVATPPTSSIARIERHIPAQAAVLCPALVAFLLLSECVSHDDALIANLPRVLHVLCVHLDGVPNGLQRAVRHAAEQILRAAGQNNSALHAALAAVHEAMAHKEAPARQHVVHALLALGGPMLRETWGKEALHWAATCPVRRAACCSFEVLRALHMPLQPPIFAELVARLAGTIANASVEIQAYAIQVLNTLQTMARHTDRLPLTILAGVFWAACAAASTTVEAEFPIVLTLLNTVLDRADLSDPRTAHVLLAQRPPTWDAATPSLQRLIVRGMRSEMHSQASFALLIRFASIDARLVAQNVQEGVANLLAAGLPWCMQAVELRTACTHGAEFHSLEPATVDAFGNALAHLAELAQRPDIARIATSIARARFRSHEELARQAASCLVHSVTSQQVHATQVCRLFLDLLYGSHTWVSRQTLRGLSAYLAALRTHGEDQALVPLGAQLMESLLRLLSTPLAPLALHVLDASPLAHHAPHEEAAPHLRAPPLAGWGAASAREDAVRTRTNMHALSCAWDASLDTQPERASVSDAMPNAALGDLASQLDDLASYFGQDDAEHAGPRHTEHVAKILARSMYRTRDSVLFAAAPPPPDAAPAETFHGADTASGPAMRAPDPASLPQTLHGPFCGGAEKDDAPVLRHCDSS
ncbi:Cell morphogenesis protein PAG1 [Malassezia vespertilionis]|uniref:Tao3p n=1 Tax=Malassezia vespertilionis TaxID=2020962 RepID=A0A2N1JEQ6_9BASI|nr:Cell morphogenesis protein PAG1 [Malassezia vespertilionis]PKI85006.1 Tao3p [Malassezia vespertilionis]WFD05853.1 Cell morphogenesis protein PAG1 [Malassezia vespertilionis]